MSIPSYALKTATSVFLASIALSLTPAVAHADLVKTPPSTFPSSSSLPVGDQRYIVKYENDVNSVAESKSLQEKGIDVKETLTHTMKASVVVANPNEIAALKDSKEVASVELDARVSVSGATSIWGLDRVDQRTGRDGQYAIGDEGAGVNVYVVDSGLNFSHTEFTGRVPTSWWGIHDGRAANDCSGHGTHVAGTVAGTTYGVAKKANIIPVRVLECDGSGWSSTVMAGIDWAVAHHPAGQPAVMNLSIGGFTNASFDQSVQAAVNDGITVVAAAGNDGVDACWSSPARVRSAITVAATNINDAQATWSNYGSCVDIQAPGVFIRSAWTNAPTGYNTMDGTSMAAPHVSGAAAIMLSRDRGLSPAQVHQSIINNATTGVVTANKGATPNRLLFIPTVPAHPSCSNLKLGEAWAGVGTHCGLNGSSASAMTKATDGSAADVEAHVPAVASNDSTAPTPNPTDIMGIAEPAPAPAPAVIDAMPAPVAAAPVTAPAPAQEVPAPVQKAPVQQVTPTQEPLKAPDQYVPAAGNAAQVSVITKEKVGTVAAPIAEKTVEKVTESEVSPTEAPSPVVTPAPEAVAPAPEASAVPMTEPRVDVTAVPENNPLDADAAGSSEAAKEDDSFGVMITIGSILALIGAGAVAYAIRKLRSATPSA